MNPTDAPSPTSIPQFPRHDPATAEFWEVRYQQQFAPWDAGGVPQCLKDWADAQTTLMSGRVLIPGCGSAWEVAYLDEAGWQVEAIDFSPAAVAAARRVLGARQDRVREADFFGPTLQPASVDVMYERAFLCALPRRMWSDWARRTAELIKPGGWLVGFFFRDDAERGPPFGLAAGQLESLLAPYFDHHETRVPTDSIDVFKGKETWQVWQKR